MRAADGRLKRWAAALRRETLVLWLAARHPGTPWYAKALAAAVAAYALSPVDLIPDFIPVIGYLDDLLIVPAGLWLALRLVPAEVVADCRSRAAALAERPVRRTAAVAIVCVWLVAAMAVGFWAWRAAS